MSAITAKASRKMKKYAVLTREPRCFLGSFDFSWEQRKAKELFVSTADKGYPELPVLSATQDRGMIRRDENSINIFHDKKNEAGYKRVLPGQFVIHLRSFQGGFAHSAIEGITSPAYTVFGFSEPEKHDSEYWKYVFTSKSFIRRLETVTYGIRDGRSISYDEFLTLGFVYPLKAEQTAIARYLDKLSDLITLHQRKCALIFSSFQALISMMFTTSTFSWEQRKLASLCEKFTDGDWIESKDQSDFGVRLVQTGNVGVAEYLDKPNNKKWISEDTFDRLHCEEVLPGDILISRLPEPAGRACIMPLLGAKMITAVDCTIVRTAPDMSNKFLVQYLSSQAYFDDVNICLAGGTRQRISRGNLANFDVPIPVKKSEQDAIGMFFGYLDNLITLHQRECISFTGRAGRLILSANKKRTTSSWEQRKFDEVFDCTVPNNTLSRAELSYDEGTVLNVHYGDVLIKYGSVLDVQKDDIPRIPHRCREDFNGALLQDGDVIIADTAEDETTGKACEIGNLQGSAIVSGLHTMVCRPRNRMALGYLGYYLNSNAYHHQLLPLMQGIKVLSLSRSNIQKTSVSYPIAEKEQ